MSDNREFGFLLSEVARLLRDRFNDVAQQVGLTLAQARVLAHLERHQGIGQSALAQILEVQPITLLRQIDRLVDAGLVVRQPNPSDRRAQCLYLTEAAGPMLERVWAIGTSVSGDAFAGVEGSERAAVVAALERIRDNLSSRSGATEKRGT